MTYHNVFFQFRDLGVVDVILPFILVFTIVFAVLQKIKLFGDESKKFNVVIALVMGLAVIFPHVLWGTADPVDAALVTGYTDVVEVINNSLPSVAVIVVAIVMMLLLIGVFGKKYDIEKTSIGGWVAFLSFAIVAYIFGAKAQWWGYPYWIEWFILDPQILTLVVTILVFGIIVWMITSEEKDDDSGLSKVMEEFRKGLS